MDNDCDGLVDESPAGAGSACSTGLLGACAEGVRECIGGTLTCVALLVPDTQLELCNGIDDNCNGLVDDDALGEGAACTTELPGACAEGEIHCLDGAAVCVEAVSPGSLPETCNGLDDDCDGEVDEDATDVGATCDTSLFGVCAAGVTACADGLPTCEITTQPGANAETCNALDDDCNGAIDDVSCSTGLPGICERGWFDCGTDTCVQSAEATPEVCDGLDNDCNGVVDDGAGCPCVMAYFTASVEQEHATPYLVCAEPRTWTSADAFCGSYGYTLARIDSPAENSWLTGELLAADVSYRAFIGLYEPAAEGAWFWSAGESTASTWTNWGTGEPDNWGWAGARPADCATLETTTSNRGYWTDEACFQAYPFVCEASE